MDGEAVENLRLRLTMMGAVTTIHPVLYPASAIGLSDAPQYRDWGIADSDQPTQILQREKLTL
jgi:hypothetical protein